MIDLYDLNSNSKRPVDTVEQNFPVINEMQFTSDGKRLLTGDASGRIQGFNVDSSLCQPSANALSQFETLVKGLEPIPYTVPVDVDRITVVGHSKR